jgi:hypothetical protein
MSSPIRSVFLDPVLSTYAKWLHNLAFAQTTIPSKKLAVMICKDGVVAESNIDKKELSDRIKIEVIETVSAS